MTHSEEDRRRTVQTDVIQLALEVVQPGRPREQLFNAPTPGMHLDLAAASTSETSV
jgi:hypothetical protein